MEALVSLDLDDKILWEIKQLNEFKCIPQSFQNTIQDNRDKFCSIATIKLLADKFENLE